MLLPKGITGFFTQGQQTPPRTDLAAFKKCCFAAARARRARVVSFSDADSAPVRNFHTCQLSTPEREILIMCNAHFPLVALQRDGEFVDEPQLAPFFSSDFRVLGKAELEEPIDSSEMSELDPAEVDQARYWKPRRIGDVVYNDWD